LRRLHQALPTLKLLHDRQARCANASGDNAQRNGADSKTETLPATIPISQHRKIEPRHRRDQPKQRRPPAIANRAEICGKWDASVAQARWNDGLEVKRDWRVAWSRRDSNPDTISTSQFDERLDLLFHPRRLRGLLTRYDDKKCGLGEGPADCVAQTRACAEFFTIAIDRRDASGALSDLKITGVLWGTIPF
jgi:hypothetical protein